MSKRRIEIQMDNFRRSHYVKQHDFLFDQFNSRVLCHFNDSDINIAADAFAEEAFERLGKHAPPDADPGDYADQAYEERIDFRLILNWMR